MNSKKDKHGSQMRQTTVFERPEGPGKGSDDTVTVQPQQSRNGWGQSTPRLESKDSGNSKAGQVSLALQQLADAMHKELIAKRSYQGNDWDLDGHKYIQVTKQAREHFESTLNTFVEYLTHG